MDTMNEHDAEMAVLRAEEDKAVPEVGEDGATDEGVNENGHKNTCSCKGCEAYFS